MKNLLSDPFACLIKNRATIKCLLLAILLLPVCAVSVSAVTPPAEAPAKNSFAAAVVSSVSVPVAGTYTAGQQLTFTVNYGVPITVTGAPYIGVTLNTGGTVHAAYSSTSGNTVIFTYTIVSGNADNNGITLASSITANGGTLKDGSGTSANLTLHGVGSTTTVLVDAVKPTVSSINIAGTSPTNAASLDYTVTFSENVTGVDMGDFALTYTGGVNGTIAAISGSNKTYTITVNSITGDGTMRLDLNSSGTGIADVPGNTISTGFTGGQAYTLSHLPPPSVSYGGAKVYAPGTAITTLTPASSNVDALAYNAKVAIATSTATANTPQMISPNAIAVDNSGNIYVLNNDISLKQVVRIPTGLAGYGPNFDSAYNMTTDAAGNIYVADISTTTIAKITPANVTTTSGNFLGPSGVAFDAAGNMYVSELYNGDVVKIAAGTGTQTVVASGLLSSYDVASDALGNLFILDNNSGIVYKAPTGTTGADVSTLTQIITGLTNATTVAVDPSGNVFVSNNDKFIVEYSNMGVKTNLATGLNSIWGVATDGKGNVFAADNGGSKVYQVKPAGGYFISPELPAGLSFNNTTGAISGTPTTITAAADYTITAYNALGSSSTTVNITIGSIPDAAITSIVKAAASPTNAATVDYTVTFGAPVSGLAAGNFTLATDGSISGAGVGTVTGSGTTWTVTVNTGSGDGNITLKLDNAGGLAPGIATALPFAGETYAIDKTAPSFAAPTTYASNNASSTYAKTNDVITLDVVYDNTVNTPSVTIGGNPVTPVNVTGNEWTATYPVTAGDAAGVASFSITATDLAGNSTTLTSANAGLFVVIDNASPVPAISAPSQASVGIGASPVSYDVTYSDANFGSNTLSPSDIMLNKTGTADATVAVSGTGATATVTLSNITGDGTLGISIVAGTATDLAGNTALAAGPSTTFDVDNTAPTVAITRADANPTNASSVTFNIKFNKTVTGVDASDFSVAGVGVNSYSEGAISGSDDTYSLTVSSITGVGTVGLNLNGGTDVKDAAGNVAVGATGEHYDIDQSALTVAITRADANPTNASSVTFNIKFNKTVTGVDASDFSVAGVGVNSYSEGAISGSGDTYSLTVSSITGVGTVGLNLNGGTDIKDAAGNIAVGATGEHYDIDQAVPVLSSTSISTDNSTSIQYGKTGNLVTLTLGFDEQIQTPTITLGGHATTPAGSNGDKTWTATATIAPGDPDGLFSFDAHVTDLAGNTKEYQSSDIGPGASITVDNTLPAINISAPAVSGTGAGTTVTFDVSYSDANFNSSTLSTGDITLNTTGTATGTMSLSGSGTSYQVTISNISGRGTLGLSIAANTASDLAGNFAPAASSPINYTGPNDARLKTLALNPKGSLTRVAGTDYADYTANIYGAASSVKVTPVTTEGSATVTINGIAATPGVESAPVALNADTTSIAVTVTAFDGVTKNTYRIAVTRRPSNDARLTVLSLNPRGALTLVPGPDYADYTANIYGNAASVKVTPVTAESTATLTINGVPSTPGVESAPVALNADTTAIAVTVTAVDGVTKKTYRIAVTRQPSNDARLTVLSLNPKGSLTLVPGPDYIDYTTNIYGLAGSVKVTPVTADNTATVTVNGVAATSGVESAPVALNADTTSIAVTVTAGDGTTKKTYHILATRLPSNNALLTRLSLNPKVSITKVPGPDYADYTATVANSTGSVKVIPVTSDNTATVTVNGAATTSGAESAPVTLNADTTSIAVTVTALDGVTKKNYVILVTRQAPPPDVMAYEATKEMPVEGTQLVVHQNVSPNGDGNGDALKIDGITAYPDNKLQIMSRAGNLVYEAKGYDNSTKVFDGHASNGKLQQAGTYFYSLEYKVGNETKKKTGYIVLKY